MDERIGHFLNFLAVEKNASNNTIAAYRNDLSQFTAFLMAASPGRALNGTSQEMIVRYVEHLRDVQNYKEATVARKVAAVKSFYGFLAAEGLVDHDPTEHLKSPQVGKTLPARSRSPKWMSCWNSPPAATRRRPGAIRRCLNCCMPPVCA